MGPNMKHQQHHQRQRGRGRKPGGGGGSGGGGGGGGHNSNRSFESTGPDIKVRGSASHVYEKYLQLARDANSAGDRVMAESYLQHAEHYYRIVRATQPAHQPQQQFEQRYDTRFGQDPDYADDEDGEEFEAGAERSQGETSGAEGEQPAPYRQERGPRDSQRNDGQRSDGQRHEGPRHEGPRHEGPRQEGPRAEGSEAPPRGDDGEFGRNRRNRRNRFRPEGEGAPRVDADGGPYREPREDRAPREAGPREERAPREPRDPRGEPREPREEAVAREERPERAPREPRPPREPRNRDAAEPVEGFADSPKPAFLAGE